MRTIKRTIYVFLMLITINCYSQTIINAPNPAVKQDSILAVTAGRDAVYIPLSTLSGWIGGAVIPTLQEVLAVGDETVGRPQLKMWYTSIEPNLGNLNNNGYIKLYTDQDQPNWYTPYIEIVGADGTLPYKKMRLDNTNFSFYDDSDGFESSLSRGSKTANRVFWFNDIGGELATTSQIPTVVTDHTLLTNIGTNTHAQIDTHIANNTGVNTGDQDLEEVLTKGNIAINKSIKLQDATGNNFSNLSNTIFSIHNLNTSEGINIRPSEVQFINSNDEDITLKIPSSVGNNYTVFLPSNDGTLALTSDAFTPTNLLTDYGFTDNSTNWNTAFGWGNHSIAGYGALTGTQTWTGVNTYTDDMFLGVDDSSVGSLSLYGDNTINSGSVRIYNGVFSDTTNEYYEIASTGGTFNLIGNSTGSFFSYNPSTEQITFSDYGDNLIIGTSTALLGVDSLGKMIEEDITNFALQTDFDDYLPLTAGSSKEITGDFYIDNSAAPWNDFEVINGTVKLATLVQQFGNATFMAEGTTTFTTAATTAITSTGLTALQANGNIISTGTISTDEIIKTENNLTREIKATNVGASKGSSLDTNGDIYAWDGNQVFSVLPNFGILTAPTMIFDNSLGGSTQFVVGESINTNTIIYQDVSGTVALTSEFGAYLPLTGGTMTGVLDMGLDVGLKSKINFGGGAGVFEYDDNVSGFGGSIGFKINENLNMQGTDIVLSDLAGDRQVISAKLGNIVISSDAYAVDITADAGLIVQNGISSIGSISTSGQMRIEGTVGHTQLTSLNNGADNTISFPNASGTVLLSNTTPFEKIDEGAGNGFVVEGRVATNYGSIGAGAFDVSLSETISVTLGATGDVSLAGGYETQAGGYGSIAWGSNSTVSANSTYGISFGGNNTVADYASFAYGFNNSIQGDSGASYSATFGRNNSINMVGGFSGGLALHGDSVGTAIFGQANETYTGTTSSANTSADPIFIIGNGTINNADLTANIRSDALKILLNGTISAPSLSIAEINTQGDDALVTRQFVKTKYIQVAISDLVTDLTTGTNLGLWSIPYNCTLVDVHVELLEAGTVSGITVDINENGTTVLSTKLTTDVTENGSDTATTSAVISDSSLAQYGQITFDIDAVGTSLKGAIITLTVEI